MTERGLRPWELGRLTLAEIDVLLASKADDVTAGVPLTSDADQIAYAQHWAGLTPLARLRQARRELHL